MDSDYAAVRDASDKIEQDLVRLAVIGLVGLGLLGFVAWVL